VGSPDLGGQQWLGRESHAGRVGPRGDRSPTRETPTLESILGAGKDKEASDALIRIVDRPDPRPVWLAASGTAHAN
jgi:hypothetical protein